MDSIVRGLVVYFFLLIIFRASGKRTLLQTTNFELVLLLIISETTQQAMVGDDHSILNGFLLITTLTGTSIALSLFKQRSPALDRWLDGTPLIIVENGKMDEARMHKARVDRGDILAAARELQGLERLDQIKYAILERDGQISVVPMSRDSA